MVVSLGVRKQGSRSSPEGDSHTQGQPSQWKDGRSVPASSRAPDPSHGPCRDSADREQAEQGCESPPIQRPLSSAHAAEGSLLHGVVRMMRKQGSSNPSCIQCLPLHLTLIGLCCVSAGAGLRDADVLHLPYLVLDKGLEFVLRTCRKTVSGMCSLVQTTSPGE